MKIGVLGTGMVGVTIASGLIRLGHDVMMGSRTVDNKEAAAFVQNNGPKAKQGTFKDAARFGELIFNCTKGEYSIDAIRLAGIENFTRKTVIDISNPLRFSDNGMSLFVCNTDSLAEQIQKLLPEANVVKTLNCCPSVLMINPKPNPTMFVAGNDQKAKEQTMKFLNDWGWKDIIDIGDITGARAMEMLLPIWVKISGIQKSAGFAFKVVKQ